MTWLFELLQGNSVAHTILMISLVAATGLMLGNFKIRKIGLGVAGVLFTGLFFGNFNLQLDPTVLHFLREFGLILFVYSIGLQVGPGFLESLKEKGILYNSMAVCIVLLGVCIAIGIYYFGNVDMSVVVGLFSGGTTNTPSLAAAQQAIGELNLSEAVSKNPGLGYAVAYPFGILGIILTMGVVRLFFRIKPEAEAEAFTEEQKASVKPVVATNIDITNPNFTNLAVKDIPTLAEHNLVISRLLKAHSGNVVKPTPESLVDVGDTILVVGAENDVEAFQLVVGQKSEQDLKSIPSSLTTRRIIITKRRNNGKTVGDLDRLYHVAITRVHRAEVEMTPGDNFALQYGDRLIVVGEESSLDRLSKDLGNSLHTLNHPQIVPIFVGIILGILVGSFPIQIPGVPVPVKLGLAGGPLLVSIFLSRLGYIGKLNWFLPSSANMIIREIGIVLFLAAVGLHAGDKFVDVLIHGDGLYWMGCAAMITFIPLVITGFIFRKAFKLNYLTLCGILAGSMTDPPALAFANSISTCNAANLSYAAVYPLVMVLRILSAQLLVLFFLG